MKKLSLKVHEFFIANRYTEVQNSNEQLRKKECKR